MTAWSQAQVDALAPDPASLKAGRQLAEVRKWSGLGQDERSLWGLCQGSGKEPYQAQVDLSEPAFRCSCPSRKFPCKHGLGLMMLWSRQAEAFPQGDPPGWVRDWLAGRDQRATQKTVRVEKAPDPEAQAKRSAQREARVEEGIAYLGGWLQDLMRAGLSGLPSQPESHWTNAAARLVDCQAPGLARMVARIPEILSRPEWQPRLLEHLGRLHLLLQGASRLDSLSPELQAEVRSRLGWTQSQEELLSRSGCQDRWWVVGQRSLDEGPVRTLRTWLWGEQQGQSALLLDFSAGGRPLPRHYALGMVVDAELVYFEGAAPQRALLKSSTPIESHCPPLGHATLDSLLDHCADRLALNPWQEEWPALLDQVVPGVSQQCLVDRDGRKIPLHPAFSDFWRLCAISGGHPVTVFGEWDGYTLRPLSVLAQGRICPLGQAL